MPDLKTALISAHEKSIQRYCHLLATPLTELERDYIHRQIAMQRAELERLLAEQSAPLLDRAHASIVIAAKAMGEGGESAGH